MMCNSGVKCDVNDCMHNVENKDCKLHTIEVTKQTAGVGAMDTPHFCKSFQKR